MKRGTVLSFVVLLVAIALIGCSQLPGQMVPPTPAGEPVEGEAVGFGFGDSIRLFTDPQTRNLAFEIEGGRVYAGTVQQGQIILYFSSRRIFAGPNATADILYTIEGNRLVEGAHPFGDIAYTIESDRVFEGTPRGDILYSIENDRMFGGPSPAGPIVFQANRPLTGNVRFLLPILAEQFLAE